MDRAPAVLIAGARFNSIPKSRAGRRAGIFAWVHRRPRGRGCGDAPDAVIAATALGHSLALATRNAKTSTPSAPH